MSEDLTGRKVWIVEMMDNNDAEIFSNEEKARKYAQNKYDNLYYVSITEVIIK